MLPQNLRPPSPQREGSAGRTAPTVLQDIPADSREEMTVTVL